MQSQPIPPHILLVEDDPVSQTYFRAVLESLPARVDLAATCAGALDRGSAERHDLWLIDLTLPDGCGIDLLHGLQQRWPQSPPALAHTADPDPALRAQARDAGFGALLVKPLTTADLSAAVRAALTGADRPPDWDNDAAAAALNHHPGNVAALRELFLAELSQTRQQVLDNVRDGNHPALRARLHRLQASCGLVGARRLGVAVNQLHRDPGSRAALEDFIHAAHDLLH